MKVLFLDIDGVLNGHEKHPSSPYTTIRPDCVQRLNMVVSATGCKIVISSAWRYMMLRKRKNRPAAMTLLGFQYMLHTHGLYGIGTLGLVIGHTVSDEEIPERGKQILRWVAENKPESWAVVDDDPMEIELGVHSERLVKTDGKVGMSDKNVKRLIAILGKSW